MLTGLTSMCMIEYMSHTDSKPAHHQFYDCGITYYVCPTCEHEFDTEAEFGFDADYDCCGECATAIRAEVAADDTPNHDTYYEDQN
jgi:hypothetical protein